jgi:nucleotide-binding universal stress UspA family protein
MAAFRRILVPTDFTDTSERALDLALDLAARVDGSVTVMHSYEIPVVGFPDGALVATADIATRIAEASRQALEAIVAKHRGRVPIEGILREGVAWDEINAVADEIKADVIVVGTHGRRGITRALLGSVAESVIRTGTRPVLVVHGHA